MTDDSGIHSRSTSNSKGHDKDNMETNEAKSKNFMGRVSIARRPIRKLPSPPKRTGTKIDTNMNF